MRAIDQLNDGVTVAGMNVVQFARVRIPTMLFNVSLAPVKKWGEFNLELILSCQGIPCIANLVQTFWGEFADLMAVHVFLVVGIKAREIVVKCCHDWDADESVFMGA